jgi:hypothetical protein
MLVPQSSVHDVSLVATCAWRCIAFNGMEVSLAGLDNDTGVRKVEDHNVAPNRRSVMAMNNHATPSVCSPVQKSKRRGGFWPVY